MSSIALAPPYACMTAPTTGVSMEISKPTGVMLSANKTAETAIIVPTIIGSVFKTYSAEVAATSFRLTFCRAFSSLSKKSIVVYKSLLSSTTTLNS